MGDAPSHVFSSERRLSAVQTRGGRAFTEAVEKALIVMDGGHEAEMSGAIYRGGSQVAKYDGHKNELFRTLGRDVLGCGVWEEKVAAFHAA